WLIDTVTNHARTNYQADWSYAVIVGGAHGEASSALAYAVKYAEHRAPIAAYGFRTCPSFLGPSMLRSIMARRALLPVAVTGGTNIDSLLNIGVTAPTGALVFQNAARDVSSYSASAPMEQAGGFVVHATIRPRAVQTLALALPQARVPILVGL